MEPEINFEIIWVNNYYNGPLSGVCHHQDDFYWFSCNNLAEIMTSSDYDKEKRKFSLYKLSEEEREHLAQEQQRFEETIGKFATYTLSEEERSLPKYFKQNSSDNIPYDAAVFQVNFKIDREKRKPNATISGASFVKYFDFEDENEDE